MEVWETGRRGSLSLSHLTNNEQQPIEYFKTPSTQQLSTGKTAGGAQGCGSGRLLMDGWMDGWMVGMAINGRGMLWDLQIWWITIEQGKPYGKCKNYDFNSL